MKDFKNYNPEENGKKTDVNGQTDCTKDANVNATVNLAKTLSQAFNGKSEADILRTVLAQAEEGKRNGTLTNEDLDNFYNTVYPLLDGFKRQKLKQIINKLKAI